MIYEDTVEYKGFNKELVKKDLDEGELECYNKLMDGIKVASDNEKEEISHLMEIYIRSDEGISTSCNRCGVEFKDNFKEATEDNKRIYCDKCIRKMWASKKIF